MMKTCNKCGETKPTTEFMKKAQRKDGLNSQCTTCTRAYMRAYRKNNPERDRILRQRELQKSKVKIREKCEEGFDLWGMTKDGKQRVCEACGELKPITEFYNKRKCGTEKVYRQRVCGKCTTHKKINTLNHAKHTLRLCSSNLTVGQIPDELAEAYLVLMQLKRKIKETYNEKCSGTKR